MNKSIGCLIEQFRELLLLGFAIVRHMLLVKSDVKQLVVIFLETREERLSGCQAINYVKEIVVIPCKWSKTVLIVLHLFQPCFVIVL